METTKIIEQYLEGSLDEQEKTSVESRAESDKDFKELINLHKEVNESIRDEAFFRLHRLIEKVSAEYIEIDDASIPPVRSSWMNKGFMRIAAILLVILSAAVILKMTLINPSDPEKIYNRYYQAYDADVISRSGISEEITLDRAIGNYNNGNYQEALQILNEVLRMDQQNYMAWFYKGLTYMESDQPVEAVKSFKSVPEQWDSLYKEHRDWYLALTLLHMGQVDEAAELFSKIGEGGAYYADKARIIHKKLIR